MTRLVHTAGISPHRGVYTALGVAEESPVEFPPIHPHPFALSVSGQRPENGMVWKEDLTDCLTGVGVWARACR